MKIHFFPTVWTDCILLEKDGHYGLVDCHMNLEKFNNYMAGIGVSKLDFIILTHFHQDHYGSIAPVVKKYDVEKVIFKDFSGVVSCTSNGKPADDQYRLDETNICNELKETIKEYSRLIMSNETDEVFLDDIKLKLFYRENIMRTIYDDETSPAYNRFVSGENNNNMPVFFEYKGRNVLLAGDITDAKTKDERTDFMNNRLAKKLNCKLDIYKCAHHGKGAGTPETLNIYKPDYTVITNKVENSAEAVELLKNANPDMEIYIMSNGGKVFNIDEQGEITVTDLIGYTE